MGRPDTHFVEPMSKADHREFLESCMKDGFFEAASLPGLAVELSDTDYLELDFSSAHDFVVVDEGQDFRNDPVTLAFLNLRIKGGLHKGNVVWMQDLNQSIPSHFNYGFIQGTPVFSPESEDYLKIDLNKVNYRNPYSISVMTSNLLDLRDRVKSSGGGDFKNPIITVTVNDDLPVALHSSLRHLVKAGVALRDVMVVSVSGENADELQNLKLLGDFRFSYEEDEYSHETINQLPENTVRWSRLYDVKGREFPVIVLIDLPDLCTETGKVQAYVAATRATSLLYVLGESAELQQWTELLGSSD
jgi:DNA helicase IV